GAEVIALSGARRDAAEALAADLQARGLRAEADAADLTAPGAAEALAARHAPLDILVHAAARQDLASLADTDDALWHALLSANVAAAASLLRALAPQGLAAAVLVSSIEARSAAPAHGAYAASKAALEALARAAAREHAPTRVNALAPGLTDRPGLAEAWPQGHAGWSAACPLGRPAAAEEVADAALFLAAPAGRFVNGTVLTVDGGLSAVSLWQG
ncbi:MAG: SDR family oxidoreductase, partial [Pseudomonadota bacterium]